MCNSRVLCETVKDFLSEVGKSYREMGDDESDESIAQEVRETVDREYRLQSKFLSIFFSVRYSDKSWTIYF